jgi:SAM-dependent methyltransferase
MGSFAAAALVFATSATVLLLEILAGRLLAPHVGVTLETYTGIIGTVLAGISVGTWLGGRAADRTDPRRLLAPLLVAGGASALLVVPLVDLVAALRPGAGPGAVVLYAAVAFLAPAAVLSAVAPAVVKLQLADVAHTGRVVGRLSAVGTAGAIFGTFATGFVLVAALPTRLIVVGVGILLITAGVAVWAAIGRHAGRSGGAGRLPPAALAVALLGLGWAGTAPQRCERETAYYCVRVVADPARPTGRTLLLDTLRHSYVDLADPTHLEFSYTRILGDVVDAVAPEGAPIDSLHIGGGGFTLPRYIEATRPGSFGRVLELDATVVEVARTELGLRTSEHLEVRVGDARMALRDEPAGRYDLVVGDAFGGLAVPWHLATREHVEGLRRVLRPGGIYVVNVIDYPPLRFARAEAATLRRVFRHTGLIAPSSRIAGREGGNLVFVGSDAPIDARAIEARITARLGVEIVVVDDALAPFVADAQVLTDDHAPVDQLLTTH